MSYLASTVNSHMSLNYIKPIPWEVKEAIREIFQNYRDASYDYLLKEYTNFSFRAPRLFRVLDNNGRVREYPPDGCATNWGIVFDDKIFSTIMYNEAKSELTFTNPGKFSPRCFILGGSDAEKHSKGPKSPNAGKFGEGGNLAILIFVAKGISITIATGEDYYSFHIEEDSLYSNEKCLFINRDPRKKMEENYDPNTVTVRITGIDKKTWLSATENFLDLAPPEVTFSTVTVPEVKDIGELLLSDKHKSHVYVKGLFVCKEPYSRKFVTGVNLFDVGLDRDRGLPINEREFVDKMDRVVGAVLNMRVTNPQFFKGKNGDVIDDIIKELCQQGRIHNYRTLYTRIKPETSYRMLAAWREIKGDKEKKLLPTMDHTILGAGLRKLLDTTEQKLSYKISHIYSPVHPLLFACLCKCAVSPKFENGFKMPTKWISERLEDDETVVLDGKKTQEAKTFFPGGLVVKKWKYKILVKKGEKCYIPSDLLEGGDFRKILWNAMKGGYEIVDIQ